LARSLRQTESKDLLLLFRRACFKKTALYQGTTSVVPEESRKVEGLSHRGKVCGTRQAAFDKSSSNSKRRYNMTMRMHNPSHPGRILAYYLEGRSVTEVARHMGVTRPALSRVLNGKAGVSADMALRIAEAFNTDPEFWLRLQAQRDLWVASRKKRKRVKPLVTSVAA
jgi:addiction module HigA family antidote